MNKGLILKTAVVASCVSVLIITGCQGGLNEATAVKNKTSTEIEVNDTKESEEIPAYVEEDRTEDIEDLVRDTGLKGQNTETLRNDKEREAAQGRIEPEAHSEAEPPEDEAGTAGEEDRGTEPDGEVVGEGDGAEDESAESVSVSEPTSDMESTDSSAGWDGWMEDDSAVSEFREWDWRSRLDESVYDSGFEPEPEQYNSGVDEQGYSDADRGLYEESDGYEYEPVPEPEAPDPAYEEPEGTGDGWEYYTTARITFYDSGPCCCGPYASDFTASGEPAIVGWTCANGALPFGTMVLIDGQEYCVTDRGVGADEFDILVESHDEALARGMYYTDVFVRW